MGIKNFNASLVILMCSKDESIDQSLDYSKTVFLRVSQDSSFSSFSVLSVRKKIENKNG